MFFVIFSIVIALYILANVYIFKKGAFAIAAFPVLKNYFSIIFWFLALSYPVGRILERVYLSHLSDFLIFVGSLWLAAMLYLFLICLLIDVFRLINKFLPFFPQLFATTGFKAGLFWVIIAGITLLITGGYINSMTPVVKNVDINIPKNAGQRKSLNAVLISDVHLGTIIGNKHLENIVSKINDAEPEIVFMAGDIVDEDLEPVLRQNIGNTLKKLQAPLGVYAVTGNHEYIGGAEAAVSYLEEHGITFIRDTVIKIDESFYILGREDLTKPRFSDERRRSLDDLIAMTDPEYPLLLLDHQPFYLEKAAKAGIDLQLSGHTHHGQLWPINYITSAIYDISRGYDHISGMHAYVTSGVGTWGPPVRIGSRSEIINLNVYFK